MSAAIVLTPPFVVPSTQYMRSNYPASLAEHLLSLVTKRSRIMPAPKPARKASIPSFDVPSQSHIQNLGKHSQELSRPSPVRKDTKRPTFEGPFLGMPNMNLYANIQAMDVRKWNWPDDMTFGRKAAKKYSDTNKEANPIRISNKEVEGKEVDGNIKVGPAEDESKEESQHHGAKAEVDTTSLTDAIMSDPAFPPSNRGHGVDIVQGAGVTFSQGSSSAELTIDENSSTSSPAGDANRCPFQHL